MWLNDEENKLSLMTHRGVETISKEELAEEEEWETFTQWVERSVTTVVYQADPRLWNELQTQSASMAQLGKRRLLGSVMMIFALLIGAGIFFFYYSWDHIPYFLQTESSDLVLMSLGAMNAELLTVDNLYRLLASLALPGPSLSLLFNLFTLYWVARPLEQLWGTRWVLLVYVLGYIVGATSLLYLDPNQLFVGAQCSSLALCIATYTYYTQLRAGTQLSSPPLILKKHLLPLYFGLYFHLLSQGFERTPSYALESAWIITAVCSIFFGYFLAQMSVLERNWVLSNGEKWSISYLSCAQLYLLLVSYLQLQTFKTLWKLNQNNSSIPIRQVL